MLDDSLLDEFVHKYFNYGKIDSEYYFIGMEEGGGDDEQEVENRLNAWATLNKSPTIDNREFHRMIGYREYFTHPPSNKAQKTWSALIRIMLTILGEDATLNNVKKFQATKWGTTESNNYIGELLPLPSPSIGKWHYNKWSNIEYLISRDIYRDYCVPFRIEKLQYFIRLNEPKVVVFYGTSYMNHWLEITKYSKDNNAFINKSFSGLEFHYKITGNTIFIVTSHPASYGVTNQYFTDAGNFIKDWINGTKI